MLLMKYNPSMCLVMKVGRGEGGVMPGHGLPLARRQSQDSTSIRDLRLDSVAREPLKEKRKGSNYILFIVSDAPKYTDKMFRKMFT